MFGGHGIIEETIAKKFFKDFLRQQIVVTSFEKKYGISGFQNMNSVDPQKLNRAPNPKLRMKVLKRENYKCKICGRSPNDYSDIELHIHHIKPHSNFGLTEEENLITLCHTCHKGLDPHFDWNLFSLIGTDPIKIYLQEDLKEKFIESVEQYQRLIRGKLLKNNKR